MTDETSHPDHYASSKYEVWDIIALLGLGFELGNVLKYAARAGHKPGQSALDDAQKCANYAERAIDFAERGIPLTTGRPDTLYFKLNPPDQIIKHWQPDGGLSQDVLDEVFNLALNKTSGLLNSVYFWIESEQVKEQKAQQETQAEEL